MFILPEGCSNPNLGLILNYYINTANFRPIQSCPKQKFAKMSFILGSKLGIRKIYETSKTTR